ncbi:MAG: DUF3276 family protein, partial [Bacteroides sp.]
KKRHSDVEKSEKDIVYSQAIKAGKRIYYLDVKMNRKDELFLAITESKKIITGEGEEAQVNFEKHKIFLYKEDLEKFQKGLDQAISYIRQRQPARQLEDAEETPDEEQNEAPLEGEIKIDIDF